MKKYRIPTIEEFVPGFEFEHHYASSDKYVPDTIVDPMTDGLKRYFEDCLKRKVVRVRVKRFSWVPGRLDCAYKKITLYKVKLGRRIWDAYLIKYEPKAVLPPHKDVVHQGKHWRINIVLWGKGKFKVEKHIFRFKGICWFRPDLRKHVMFNGNNERMVLSFGYARLMRKKERDKRY